MAEFATELSSSVPKYLLLFADELLQAFAFVAICDHIRSANSIPSTILIDDRLASFTIDELIQPFTEQRQSHDH